MSISQRLILAATALLGGILPGALAAQSYGGGDQVLTVDVPSFRPSDAAHFRIDPNGYLYWNDSENGDVAGSRFFFAPVLLPDGAEITQICLYADNSNADPTSYVALQLQSVQLVQSGQAPAVIFVPNTAVTADFHFGYGTVCTDPIAYTIHGLVSDERVVHRLQVSISDGTSSLGLGGARIVWHRQVSSPPATASFTDVPTTSGLFPFVEALAAAGITGGYPDGRFGVNDPITRGQMAVFLSGALGLHWPY